MTKIAYFQPIISLKECFPYCMSFGITRVVILKVLQKNTCKRLHETQDKLEIFMIALVTLGKVLSFVVYSETQAKSSKRGFVNCIGKMSPEAR